MTELAVNLPQGIDWWSPRGLDDLAVSTSVWSGVRGAIDAALSTVSFAPEDFDSTFVDEQWSAEFMAGSFRGLAADMAVVSEWAASFLPDSAWAAELREWVADAEKAVRRLLRQNLSKSGAAAVAAVQNVLTWLRSMAGEADTGRSSLHLIPADLAPEDLVRWAVAALRRASATVRLAIAVVAALLKLAAAAPKVEHARPACIGSPPRERRVASTFISAPGAPSFSALAAA